MARYTSVARLLHWIIAILILVNLWLGFAHDSLPKEWKVMPVHKSIGLTVLALTLVRLSWRLAHKPPALPAAMPGWEKLAANLNPYHLLRLHADRAAVRLDHVVGGRAALELVLPVRRAEIRRGQGRCDRRHIARGA